MSDQLREAIDNVAEFEFDNSGQVWGLDEVLAAARRFLALTETGPDYERADVAFRIALATTGARSTEARYVPVQLDFEAALTEGAENGLDEVGVWAILRALGLTEEET